MNMNDRDFTVQLVAHHRPERPLSTVEYEQLASWRVRIVPSDNDPSPSDLGMEYYVRVGAFNFDTFLGDTVKLTYSPTKGYEGRSIRRAYQPNARPRTPAAALEALQKERQAVTAGPVPDLEVAGRANYASYLLSIVLGTSSWQGPGGDRTQQTEAIDLAARIFDTLNLDRIQQVGRSGCHFDTGCWLVIKAARTYEWEERLATARAAMEYLHFHLPEPRSDSDISWLFSMASQANQYGRDLGFLTIDTILSMGASDPSLVR